MQSESSQPMLSTDNSAFLELVESRIKQGEPVVILLRFSRQGGSRAYFILKTIDEFHQVLQKARPQDAVSVFFSQSFPVQGKITPEVKDRTISFLNEVIENDEEAIFVIRLDADEIILDTDDMKAFSEPEKVDEWFNRNLGVPVIVGILAFWQDDSEEMVTAYVRDSDGEIRRGAN